MDPTKQAYFVRLLCGSSARWVGHPRGPRITMERSSLKPPKADEVRQVYRIDFRVGFGLFPEGDDVEYIRRVTGEIVCSSLGDGENQCVAGTLDAYVIKVERIQEAGLPLIDICDEHSQTLFDYASVLFDERRNTWKRSIERQCGGVVAGDALVLDQIVVRPEHRGRGVGLAAAWRFLELFEGGCGLAACEPYPMQFKSMTPAHEHWCAEMQADKFAADKDVALSKLRSYWSRLGFVRLRGSTRYVLNLARRRATLDRLLGSDRNEDRLTD